MIKLCSVENCINRAIHRRTLCQPHKYRREKYKSFGERPKVILAIGIVKICKIHGELSREQTRIYKRKNNKDYYLCLACARKSGSFNQKKRRTKEEYKEYHRIKQKEWRAKNYEKCRQIEKKSREKKNKRPYKCYYKRSEIGREYHKKYRMEGRKNLSDFYIKHLLGKGKDGKMVVSAKQISPELVEAKRMQLLLKRKLKELRNGDKQCSGTA